MPIDQLPPELLLWIGGYLTSTSLALFCFYNKYLRSTFGDRLSGIEITSLVLLWAAEVGDTKITKLALKYGADVNNTNFNGRTALSFVAERGDVEMTRLLLEVKDVDIYRDDTNDGSPLSRASRLGHAQVVDLLVAAHVESADESAVDYIERALTQATWHLHARIVKTLLVLAKKEPDFRGYDGYGQYLLCSAALDGQEKIVELFLAAKINHNARDTAGRSALYLASGEHSGVMKLLLAAGADVNMSDRDGRTPLMRAVERGYKIGVEILLEAKGVDINVPDVEGETALSLAEQGEHEEIVELLYAAG
jgi:ankyrin repeat protein